MTTLAQGDRTTQTVYPYQQLEVVASGAGSLVRLADSMGEEPLSFTALADGDTVLVGPFASIARFALECTSGSIAYSMAPVDFPTLTEAMVAAGFPSARPADVVELFGDGAPVAPVQAALTVNPAGAENALTFTAVAFGDSGNDITIEYRAQDAAEAPLTVSVDGTAIVVLLEMDDSDPPAIVSTAADVLAAIEASAEASALVTVAIAASDTGDSDDGSGVVTARTAANLADGEGTGVGVAGKGSRYTDYTTPDLYLNTGTADEPDWVALAFVS